MSDVWTRFERELRDDLLRGVTAAFALIATADTKIAYSEIERFLEVVQNEPRFAHVQLETVDSLFRALAKALLDEPEPNRSRALKIVAQTSKTHAEIVVSVAQQAIVADAHLVNVEELALGEICEAVGIDASDR